METSRRKARKLALQALYEYDCVGHDPVAAIEHITQEKPLGIEAVEFAKQLVTGVREHQVEIDAQIRRFAPTFPVEQLALIDRVILRIAILEIVFEKKVPMKAAINEAVELAKIFGNTNSARFVNGVLGSLSSVILHG